MQYLASDQPIKPNGNLFAASLRCNRNRQPLPSHIRQECKLCVNGRLASSSVALNLHHTINPSRPRCNSISAMSYILRRAVLASHRVRPVQCTRIVAPIVMQSIASPARRNYAAHQAEESYDAFNERYAPDFLCRSSLSMDRTQLGSC